MLNNFSLAKPYGVARQKLFHFQMLLGIDKSGEQDEECSYYLMETNHDLMKAACRDRRLSGFSYKEKQVTLEN